MTHAAKKKPSWELGRQVKALAVCSMDSIKREMEK